MSLGTTFNGLPSWAKGTISVILVAGVIGGAYLTFKKIQTIVQDRKRRDEEKAITDKLAELNKNPSTKQKLSDISIKSMANVIHTSLNGMGTDYWAVSTEINRLKNDADFLALKEAFGTRTINSGVYLVPDFKGSLSECIRDEMSADEVLDLNKLIAGKGIKYRI